MEIHTERGGTLRKITQAWTVLSISRWPGQRGPFQQCGQGDGPVDSVVRAQD